MNLSHVPGIESIDFLEILLRILTGNVEVQYSTLEKLHLESELFFWEWDQKIGDWYSIFTTFAGKPHLAKTDFSNTETYLKRHNERYGTDIAIPAMITFPLHHVCWLTDGENHFSWNDLCEQNPETRKNILATYGDHIQKDIQFLAINGNSTDQFHTTMAAGYSDDRWKKSAQSVRSIHVHNLKYPNSDNISHTKIAIQEHIAFLLQLRNYHIITHWNAEKIYWIFKKSFQDMTDTEGIRIQRNPKNRFGKLTFECSSPSGMPLSEVLDHIGNFYHNLCDIWKQYRTESISDEERESSLQKRVQSSVQADMIENPSFNVILTWNEDYAKIVNISIALSPLGPAERLNNALIDRKKVE